MKTAEIISKGAEATSPEVQQLDFEFVLLASAVIDYDYIMGLLARYTREKPGKQTMSRDELIGLIQSDAKFMDDRDDIAAYIGTLKVGKGLDEKAIRSGMRLLRQRRIPVNWRIWRSSMG